MDEIYYDNLSNDKLERLAAANLGSEYYSHEVTKRGEPLSSAYQSNLEGETKFSINTGKSSLRHLETAPKKDIQLASRLITSQQ